MHTLCQGGPNGRILSDHYSLLIGYHLLADIELMRCANERHLLWGNPLGEKALKSKFDPILHLLRKRLRLVISNPFGSIVDLIYVIIFGFCAFLFIGNLPSLVELGVWYWKIENNEVETTTATVIDKRISQYSIHTSRTNIFQTSNFETCSFTYIYQVNEKTYQADESYEATNDSLCYQATTEIEIYYDPNDVKKSISVNMGHARKGSR